MLVTSMWCTGVFLNSHTHVSQMTGEAGLVSQMTGEAGQMTGEAGLVSQMTGEAGLVLILIPQNPFRLPTAPPDNQAN